MINLAIEIDQNDTKADAKKRLRPYILQLGNGCQVWTRTHNRQGYGVLRFKGRQHKAHRLVYETYVGAIPDKHAMHHTCECKACVNPSHLVPLTPEVHGLISKPAQAFCIRGHPMTPENLYAYPKARCKNGNLQRTCRKCSSILFKIRYRKQKGKLE